MSWKLSVAEYIPPFIRGRLYQSTLNGAHPGGAATAINVNDTDGRYTFLQGDVIKIGPSTDSANYGAIDYKVIEDDNVAGNYDFLDLVDTFTYDYAADDPVEGVGHAIAEGWQKSGVSSPDAVIGFLGAGGTKSGVGGDLLKGFNSSLTGQWLELATGTAGIHYLTCELNRRLLTETPYRLGVYIKQAGHNNNTSNLVLYNIAELVVDIDTSANYADWTKVEDVGTTAADTFENVQVRFSWDNTAALTMCGLDCIYLTHAALTDGVASGAYTIPINPATVTEVKEDREKIYTLATNVSGYLGSLNHLPVRGYKLQFDDGNAAIIKQLEIFQYWQNRGNILMLESDITGDRPIFGFMDFGFSFDHWDDTRVSINFVFRGI